MLLIVLGSFAAMTMPLIIAFTGIALAMTIVVSVSSVVDIASFAPSLAVMIALGVGIDYALLIISRFRGERRRGEDVREATINALNTAGRSVLFAGTTVVIALLGMLLLGIGFLNGPAIASALAVFCTMIGSLTLLPALLGSFGHRVKLGKIKPPDASAARFRALGAHHRRPAEAVRDRHRHPAAGRRVPGARDAARHQRFGQRCPRYDHADRLRPAVRGLRPRLQRPAARRRRAPRERWRAPRSTSSRRH